MFAFKNILKYWLDLGVDGFRVDAISHIYEDKEFNDEPSAGNTIPVDIYGHLKHIYTTDQPETFELLYKWRKFLDDYTKANNGDTRFDE